MVIKPAVATPVAGTSAVLLAGVDPYFVHLALCALVAGAGAVTFRLGSEPLTWRTARYVTAAAMLGGILTPALGELKAITQLSYLLAIAFVIGMAADRLIRIIPVIVAGVARRAAVGWAAGWAAAVVLPPEAPFTPGDTRPPSDPTP